MKSIHFIFLTVVIGIISELVHPDMKTWGIVSIVAYMICGFFAILAIYFHKKDGRKFIKSVTVAIITFTEYAVITAIAYLRMIDTIIADGPAAIVATIVAVSMFSIIAFWSDITQRRGNHKQKK